MKIVVIGSAGVATIPHYVAALTNGGFDVSLILNGARETTLGQELWSERTAGRLTPPSIDVPTYQVERISTGEGANILGRFDLALNGGCIDPHSPSNPLSLLS